MKDPRTMKTGQLRKYIEDCLILSSENPTSQKIFKKAEVMFAKGQIFLHQLDHLEKDLKNQVLRM